MTIPDFVFVVVYQSENNLFSFHCRVIREQCHLCVSIRLLSQLSSRLLLVKLSVAQSFSRSYVKPGSHMPPIHLRHTSAAYVGEIKGSSNVYLMFRFTCLE